MIVDGLPLAWMPRWGKLGVIWASLESSSHNWAAEQASHLVLVRKHLFPVEKGSQTNSPKFSQILPRICRMYTNAEQLGAPRKCFNRSHINQTWYIPCFVFRLFLIKKKTALKEVNFLLWNVSNWSIIWGWVGNEQSVVWRSRSPKWESPFLQNLHLATSSRAFPTAMSFSTSNLNLIQQFQLHYIKRPWFLQTRGCFKSN